MSTTLSIKKRRVAAGDRQSMPVRKTIRATYSGASSSGLVKRDTVRTLLVVPHETPRKMRTAMPVRLVWWLTFAGWRVRTRLVYRRAVANLAEIGQ